jgi:RimJ/RimL family protein N-acetyltransferase
MAEFDTQPSSPEIETARLTLHRPTLGDYAECAAMWGDPDTTRFIGNPSTPEESWSRLLRYAGHWAWLGYGFWILRDRATGRFAGDAGFKQFRRDLDPALQHLPEIGWVLAPWARGRGLATEATAAALHWADTEARWPETVCIIDPGNHASLRVAAKMQFGALRDATYKDKPITIFRRPIANKRTA